MKRYAISLALAIVASCPVYALPLKLTDVAVMVGQGLDGWSTVRFLHNGHGCVEGNPVFGPQPHDMTIIGAKVGLIAINMFMVRFVEKRDKGRGWRVAAKTVAYTTAVLGAKDGIRNFALCGF